MQRKNKQPERNGVTLVEILLVITIMSVLSVMIIPRVRNVNKDRNIREAARVVGSIFANASNRAVADGQMAGVMIKRNVNNPLAGTRVFEMRSVPNYTGDDNNAGAWRPDRGAGIPTDYRACRIPRPLNHDENEKRYVVHANDFIKFNNQSFGYRIERVREVAIGNGEFALDLRLSVQQANSVKSTNPPPALELFDDSTGPLASSAPGGTTFSIKRRPRAVRSSVVDLPAGYEIDLRYSGWFGATDTSTNMYDPNLVQFRQGNEDSDIVVMFDEVGGIDSVGYSNGAHVPTSSLHLLVSENDLNLTNVQDPMVRGSNLWVSVNHLNGGTSIGYNSPQLDLTAADPDNAEIKERIIDARSLVTKRQNAAQ